MQGIVGAMLGMSLFLGSVILRRGGADHKRQSEQQSESEDCEDFLIFKKLKRYPNIIKLIY